jgi:hypothetical protein
MWKLKVYFTTPFTSNELRLGSTQSEREEKGKGKYKKMLEKVKEMRVGWEMYYTIEYSVSLYGLFTVFPSHPLLLDR